MRLGAGTVTIVLLLAGWGLAPSAGRSAPAREDFGGLPEGPGREEVFYACNVCHSIRLVTQQRLPRRRWDELLDTMVEKQGMAPLPPEDRGLILDYLAGQLNPEVPR
jgi:hypothetical protein